MPNNIRPSSSTTKHQIVEPSELSKKRISILILTMITIIIFLFILSLLLLCALVVVGKGLSQNDKQLITKSNELSSLILINHSINKNTIDTGNSKLKKKFNMIGSKVIENLTFRLPNAIKPIKYNLELNPNLKTKLFSGNVKIDIKVSDESPFIALHSKFLNISKVNLMKNLINGFEGINIKNSFEYEKFEYFVVEPEVALQPGNYTIDMDFNGSLQDKIVGFYGSTYLDKMKNQTRYIATSKFEPTFARQSFPCFDEPAMKAKFKVSLTSPIDDNYHALSNMNIENTTDDLSLGLRNFSFTESVPMSTYLTVFIVSDFAFKNVTANVDSKIGAPFDLRVYSTPAQVHKLDYALKVAKDIIEYYINYFQVPYPLPKLDLAAIPDFVSGAMETWGLVTFRETNLLYDSKFSSTANKQRTVAVISHELSHMFFGDLVTMDWWNSLWLNEGFASYIEFKGIAAAEPTWNIENQFTIDTMHSVLELDATLNSHPIVVAVETPDQITEIFDGISYNKGASIIRMVEDFVGTENFRNGVTDYLNEMKYSSANSDDLLRNLKKYTDLDVSTIVNTWIRQKGLPLVTVVKKENTIVLTQKRFLTDPENEEKETTASEYNYKWSIPITYFSNINSTVSRAWFDHSMDQLVIPIDSNIDYIKLNKDQIGYYRVNYEKSMWDKINEALKTNIQTMSILDRAHILNDVFSLAQAQQVEYSTALKMTEFLKGETSFIPWSVVSTKLKEIKNLLYNTELYTKFIKYVNSLIDEEYKSINWHDFDDHVKNLHRITILNLACSFDHQECIQKVGSLFLEWINSGNDTRPPSDLRSLIYYHGMRSSGSEEIWNKMFELFANEQDASEKSKLQSGLSAIQDVIILEKYIELASKNEDYVRKQDYFSLLSSISGNRKGEPLVWDYVRTHWPELVERFGLNERNLGRMIPNISNKFTTEIRLKEMQNFFAEHPEAGAGANARKQALENIQNNIKWLKNNKNSIGIFLQNISH